MTDNTHDGNDELLERDNSNKTESADLRLMQARAKQFGAREQARKNNRRSPESFGHSWVAGTAIGTLLLLFIGITGISPDSGPVAALRNIVMSVLGAALVYGVGYFSIKIGAERVASGDRAMLALCLAGFLATSLIIAPTTYFAMAKKIAVEIGLTDQGQHIKANIEAANRVAIESQTIKPIIVDGREGISAKRSCERAVGCLTGKPYAGTGPAPVSDYLGSATNQFDRAVRTMENAEARRDDLIRDLNKAGDSFNEIASDRSKNAQEKRKALIALDSKIRDKLAQLEQVSPARVLQSLSRNLSSSSDGLISANGQGEGMEKAVRLVRGHATRLSKALAELNADLTPLKPFPAPVGVADAFSASVLPNTLPYLFLAVFLEFSGVFCFLLCVKYHRGLILDHLALMEMEAQENSNNARASHVGNFGSTLALNGAGKPRHPGKVRQKHHNNNAGHVRGSSSE